MGCAELITARERALVAERIPGEFPEIFKKEVDRHYVYAGREREVWTIQEYQARRRSIRKATQATITIRATMVNVFICIGESPSMFSPRKAHLI